ncbi:class I SAM-dependent methyltransferase [Aquisediminimonas sediminicola]|uniref:class I SAM-dependent methyltransferase n=1 Tax=Alteraquisediminimonas sediminicola TaxID=2676787 RepID=UPI001C8DD08F|nr:class I SAM-dependent methyltransferase [Aquisediminimonas sediminicola]
MEQQAHWSDVYTTKAPDTVSWYQPTPAPSLHALDRLHIAPTASVIDIGGGASYLVDHLLMRGFSDVTVLDIAAPALDIAKARLGEAAVHVHWVVADMTLWVPGRCFDVWHDRAVFHFLTEEGQRAAYRKALEQALAPMGVAIIATFALDGPEKCSGLAVQRYDAAGLAKALGPAFALVADWREVHVTPGGGQQAFTWGVFKRA